MEQNMVLEKQIDEYLVKNKQNIIDDIMKLIRIKSVSVMQDGPMPFGEGCKKVLDTALDMGEKMGLTPKNYDYYLGSLQYGNQEDDLAIVCHLDVVPEGNDWQNSPYDPVLKDGYIVGRGSCDNKGPAVAGMYVLKFLKEMGIPLKHNVKLLLGCNEESGMKDMEHYSKVAKPPVFAMTPDAGYPVCHGEKGILMIELKVPVSGGTVVDAGGGLVSNMVADRAYVVIRDKKASDFAHLDPHKFIVENTDKGAKITAVGVSAHASMPKGSVNAVDCIFRFLLEESFADSVERKAAQTIVNILSDFNGAGLGIPLSDEPSGKLTHICGRFEMVDNALILNFNIRYPVTTDSDAMLTDLKKAVAAMGCELVRIDNDPPCYTPADSDEIKFLVDLYNNATGESTKPYIMGGGTYARKFPHGVAYGAEIEGVPNPFGAGCGGPHQPDECMSVEHILFTIKMYTLAMIGLDKIL